MAREIEQKRPNAEPQAVLETCFPVLDETDQVIGLGTVRAEATAAEVAETNPERGQGLFEQTEHLAKLGLWEWDEVEDRAVYCSEELARLHGVSVEEYMRRTNSSEADLEWVWPADRSRVWRIAKEAREQKTGFEVEYSLVRDDGEVLDVVEVAAPILDGEGRLVRSVGFVQDITERKRAETALARTHALYEETERLARLGHWEWDEIEDKCIYCSDELACLHGISVADYVRQANSTEADLKWIHPDDRDRYHQAIEKFAHEGVEGEIEYRLLSGDKQVLDVREVLKPVFDTNGSLVRSVGFVQDITERKEYEDRLRSSEALLKQATEMADLGHWVWDELLDRCIYCSETLAKMNNLSVAEYLAKFNSLDTLLPDVHPDDRARYQETVAEAKTKVMAYDIIFRDWAPEGGYRYLRERGEPVVDANGQLTRTVGTLQDVSDYKRAEDAQKRAQVELEREVEARTAELRTANRALRQSEKLFRSVVDNSPNAIFLKDLHGRFRLVNRPFQERYGLAASEIVGKTSADLFPPEIAGQYMTEDRRVANTGEICEQEFEVPFFDGSVHSIWLTKFPVRDDDGTITGVATISTDVTEAKKIRQALAESEARLREAAEIAKLGHYIWDDVENRCIYCDEEYARILGLSKEEALSSLAEFEADLEWVHPDDRDRYRRTIEEAWESGSLLQIEYRIVRRDGEVRYIHELGRPTLGESGIPIQSIGTIQDITEVRRMSQDLANSEARLRQAVALAGLGYWVWDAVKDRCSYCSEENARIHGMSVEDYMVRASAIDEPFSLVHPDDRERVQSAFRALRQGQGQELEYRLVTPAGETRYVREIAVPVVDDDGVVVQERGSIQDVTEKIRAEEQLRQAQKMEAVGQLTAGLAHDFNNLLAVIHGNAEFLEDQTGGEDESTQAILRASQRGAELTQRLLAFSRQQPLRPQSVDMAALVAGMSGLLKRSLGETVEIQTLTTPELWKASADYGQVENVILNLAINARDAMPDGGKLTIECGNSRLDQAYVTMNPEAIAGDYVSLAVSDTGHGMAPEVLAHVFEPFFTTKGVGEGSGLGLSMVYGFAKQSGGHVTVESEPGAGTTVKLYLPRA